jgi:hypothetical protein
MTSTTPRSRLGQAHRVRGDQMGLRSLILHITEMFSADLLYWTSQEARFVCHLQQRAALSNALRRFATHC